MKKFFVIAFALLVASTTISSAQIPTYEELIKKDWAGYSRFSQDNGRVPQGQVIFMGDSITEVWNSLDHEFFVTNGFVSRAISGQTTEQMLCRFYQDVIALKPRAVVLLAGTNDIAMNNGFISKENIIMNLKAMCELATKHGIKVYICSILPCSEYAWRPQIKHSTEWIKDINAEMKAYASKHGKVTYIDLFNKVKGRKDGLDKNYTSDGCHPVLECYKVMENIVLQKVK
ncbi:MAG: acylhydrolase [Bacteroidales bacterium]|nr:acylhydrolase [Bacteroidales bacterium]